MPHWPLIETHRYLLQVVPPEAPQVLAAVHFCPCDCRRSVLHTLLPQGSLVLAQVSQAPEPLQEPLRPQPFFPSAPHWSCGSVLALALPHSPLRPAVFKLAAHAWQSPVHAVLQHTLSTQLPVTHSSQRPVSLQSATRLHITPCAFLVRQVPAELQYCPIEQLPSLTQPLGQVADAPSHNAAPEQIGEPVVPDFAGPQVPLRFVDCLSDAEHASHAPPQAVSQHTPSTQLPVKHSLPPALHDAPCAFFAAHAVPEQYMPLGQALSFTHDARQLVLVPLHTTSPAHTGEPDTPALVGPQVPLAVPDCLSAAAQASHAPLQAVLQQ